MKIISTSIKQTNITAVFEEIDHQKLSPEILQKSFKKFLNSKGKTVYLSVAGIIVLLLPTMEMEVVFEPKRLRVTDKSGTKIKKSKLLELFKFTAKKHVDLETLISCGFNYTVAVETEKNINYSRLLSDSFLKLISERVSKAETKIKYSKNSIDYLVSITPVEKKAKKVLVYLNAHKNISKINFNTLGKEFIYSFNELEKFLGIISKIF